MNDLTTAWNITNSAIALASIAISLSILLGGRRKKRR